MRERQNTTLFTTEEQVLKLYAAQKEHFTNFLHTFANAAFPGNVGNQAKFKALFQSVLNLEPQHPLDPKYSQAQADAKKKTFEELKKMPGIADANFAQKYPSTYLDENGEEKNKNADGTDYEATIEEAINTFQDGQKLLLQKKYKEAELARQIKIWEESLPDVQADQNDLSSKKLTEQDVNEISERIKSGGIMHGAPILFSKDKPENYDNYIKLVTHPTTYQLLGVSSTDPQMTVLAYLLMFPNAKTITFNNTENNRGSFFRRTRGKVATQLVTATVCQTDFIGGIAVDKDLPQDETVIAQLQIIQRYKREAAQSLKKGESLFAETYKRLMGLPEPERAIKLATIFVQGMTITGIINLLNNFKDKKEKDNIYDKLSNEQKDAILRSTQLSAAERYLLAFPDKNKADANIHKTKIMNVFDTQNETGKLCQQLITSGDEDRAAQVYLDSNKKDLIFSELSSAELTKLADKLQQMSAAADPEDQALVQALADAAASVRAIADFKGQDDAQLQRTCQQPFDVQTAQNLKYLSKEQKETLLEPGKDISSTYEYLLLTSSAALNESVSKENFVAALTPDTATTIFNNLLAIYNDPAVANDSTAKQAATKKAAEFLVAILSDDMRNHVIRNAAPISPELLKELDRALYATDKNRYDATDKENIRGYVPVKVDLQAKIKFQQQSNAQLIKRYAGSVTPENLEGLVKHATTAQLNTIRGNDNCDQVYRMLAYVLTDDANGPGYLNGCLAANQDAIIEIFSAPEQIAANDPAKKEKKAKEAIKAAIPESVKFKFANMLQGQLQAQVPGPAQQAADNALNRLGPISAYVPPAVNPPALSRVARAYINNRADLQTLKNHIAGINQNDHEALFNALPNELKGEFLALLPQDHQRNLQQNLIGDEQQDARLEFPDEPHPAQEAASDKNAEANVNNTLKIRLKAVHDNTTNVYIKQACANAFTHLGFGAITDEVFNSNQPINGAQGDARRKLEQHQSKIFTAAIIPAADANPNLHAATIICALKSPPDHELSNFQAFVDKMIDDPAQLEKLRTLRERLTAYKRANQVALNAQPNNNIDAMLATINNPRKGLGAKLEKKDALAVLNNVLTAQDPITLVNGYNAGQQANLERAVTQHATPAQLQQLINAFKNQNNNAGRLFEIARNRLPGKQKIDAIFRQPDRAQARIFISQLIPSEKNEITDFIAEANPQNPEHMRQLRNLYNLIKIPEPPIANEIAQHIEAVLPVQKMFYDLLAAASQQQNPGQAVQGFLAQHQANLPALTNFIASLNLADTEGDARYIPSLAQAATHIPQNNANAGLLDNIKTKHFVMQLTNIAAVPQAQQQEAMRQIFGTLSQLTPAQAGSAGNDFAAAWRVFAQDQQRNVELTLRQLASIAQANTNQQNPNLLNDTMRNINILLQPIGRQMQAPVAAGRFYGAAQPAQIVPLPAAEQPHQQAWQQGAAQQPQRPVPQAQEIEDDSDNDDNEYLEPENEEDDDDRPFQP